MRLRHAILGVAAITALGACVPASGETRPPAAPVAAAPAAEATGIAAFRGSWVGASQGEGDTRRAAALVIDASADGGLFLRWRSAEGPRDGETNDDQLKMRENTAVFAPGKTPNVWSARLDSGAQAKARLEGSVLTVELTAKAGGKTELQTYRRTLIAPGKLSLHYTRAVNGKIETTIDADFVRLP
ncbi:hypothetical protein [Inquilinus sp. Marseille-Q2685]|uniref:hypothetical protein n=1 Tax=Inquilinus sp. Marseille-Q2685 TaxID=2866581 RepID=UPI001CE3DA39|nr:hypothetical protein [Inquilinus sp. Marseille-Q2685]